MQQPVVPSTGNGLVARMIGFATLKTPVMKEVETDTDGTTQALIVVALAAVAAGIGAIGANGSNFLWQIVAAIVGWVVFSLVAYVVGRGLLKGPDTRITIGQALRMVGFAQTPKLLGALGFIPLFGWFFGAIAAVWFIIVAIYAVAEAFDVTLERGALIAVIAGIAMFAVQALIAVTLGVTSNLVNWLF